MKLLVKGGRVVDPASGVDDVRNIMIDRGRVEAVESGEVPDTAFDRAIDASGLVVFPGLIDMHVHLREPGFEDKETIETGTRSAAAGGFTTVAAMPNTDPAIDNRAHVEFVRSKAERFGYCNVVVVGAITKGRQGVELAEIGDLADAGAVAISDDGSTVMNSEIMRRAMEYLRMYDIPMIVHCEDETLAADGVMNEGYNSTRLGLKGISRLAEEFIVARDVMMAEKLGARIHVAHISTRDAVDMVRRAKARGVRVTCEVTPHHFSLTDAEMEKYDANYQMRPPLRTPDDIQALIEGLQDGTIDAIASDHAPHTEEEKDVELDYAPDGVIGLETTLTVSLTNLVCSGALSLSQLAQKLSANPARILGLLGRGSLSRGSVADLTLVDVDAERVIESRLFESKARNTPFEGFRGRGRVISVIASGRVVYDRGAILDKTQREQYAC
jgi:dihydroorotase